MGDVLDLQASFGGEGRDAGVKDQVETIWEEIFLAKNIAKQGSKIAI